MPESKTVLFCPLNSPGHINSSLGIADRLKKERKYRTVFLVLGCTIGNAIEEHGHELVTLDETEPLEIDGVKYSGALKWPRLLESTSHLFKLSPLDAFISSIQFFEYYMVGELLSNHSNYDAAIKSIGPDLIVVDAYYVPPCIVTLKDIPWVRLSSASPFSIIKSKLPDKVRPPPHIGFSLLTKEKRIKLRQDCPEKWKAMLDEWRSANYKIIKALHGAGRAMDGIFREWNCPPLEPGQQGHDSPHLNLYMYPKALDYEQDDDMFEYPPRWFRCNSLMRMSTDLTNPEEVELWDEKIRVGLRGRKEVIFFSLGSIASSQVDLMGRFVDMLKGDKERLYIVSKGVNGDKYELADNMIGGNYIPQTYLLKRANMAIIHGGNNSITEALFFGKPMIVVPVFADQFDNAQRVEDLELGRRLHVLESTKDDLLAAINDIINDKSLLKRLHDIGQWMQSQDDAGKISSVLGKLIEDKGLTDEFIEMVRSKSFDEIQTM